MKETQKQSQQHSEPDVIIDVHHRRESQQTEQRPATNNYSQERDTQQNMESERLSRVTRLQAAEQEREGRPAHPKMRHFLNWGILAVVILIVVVYLILFLI